MHTQREHKDACGRTWVGRFVNTKVKNGKYYTVLQLVSHLKTIIGIQISRKIPSKFPDFLPYRKSLPVLGKQALDVKVIYSDQINNTNKF